MLRFLSHSKFIPLHNQFPVNFYLVQEINAIKNYVSTRLSSKWFAICRDLEQFDKNGFSRSRLWIVITKSETLHNFASILITFY